MKEAFMIMIMIMIMKKGSGFLCGLKGELHCITEKIENCNFEPIDGATLEL